MGYLRLNNSECIEVGLLCFDAFSYWAPWDSFMILLVCHFKKSIKMLVPVNDDWRSGAWVGGKKLLLHFWRLPMGLLEKLWPASEVDRDRN
jgi:hypothetical protein